MFEAHAIGRNSGCRLLIGFEHRRGPAAIEDAAIWRLVDDRLDVEDLAAAFAIQMQLDLADGVAVRCRNIFQKGSIFGGAAGVVNLPRPAQPAPPLADRQRTPLTPSPPRPPPTPPPPP